MGRLLGIFVLAIILAACGAATGPRTSAPPTPTLRVGQSQYLMTVEETQYLAWAATMSQALTDNMPKSSEWEDEDDLPSASALRPRIAIVQRYYNEAVAKVPPPRWATLHGVYKQMLKHYSQEFSMLATCIEKLDVAMCDQADAEMAAGNELLELAHDEYNRAKLTFTPVVPGGGK